MSIRMRTIAFLAICQIALPMAALADDWTVTYPPAFKDPTWLPQKQRLCFAVEASNLDSVIKDGTNVICGGTNAAGIGFAGGPFILGKDGEIVEIRSGRPVPEKTLGELRARVDKAHGERREGPGRSDPLLHDSVDPDRASGMAGGEFARGQTNTGRPAQRHARAGLLEFALR